MCDYSDPYIFVKGKIIAESKNENNPTNKKFEFKNKAPFRSYISKINNTFIYNAEDLGIVMLMLNLLQYSYNYSLKSGSLWNYYRDKVNDAANENDAANHRIKNKKTKTSISIEYKT